LLKYQQQEFGLIEETQEIYKTITKPFILNNREKHLEWLYNVLEKKKEAEHILLEKKGENGFLLLNDLSFRGKTNIQ